MGSLTLQIKHGQNLISIDHLDDTSTLLQLQEAIEQATGVMTRKQKLLCKGKVITALPPLTTLQAAHIGNGAKIMLITTASTGKGASQSQGAAALQAAQKAKMEALKERLKSNRPTSSAAASLATTASTDIAAGTLTARIEAWSKTGVASLRDLKLTEIPAELFTHTRCAETVRVLDLGGNNFSELSPLIANLKKLQKLRLSFNILTDEGMPWEALCTMTQLVVLTLDHNKLTHVPDSISSLTNLQKLTLDHNACISQLPSNAFSSLTSLRALNIGSNALIELPTGLSECVLLEELDASDNKILKLPSEIGKLKALKTLVLDDNK